MPMPTAALLGPSVDSLAFGTRKNAKQWPRYQRASFSTRVAEYGVGRTFVGDQCHLPNLSLATTRSVISMPQVASTALGSGDDKVRVTVQPFNTARIAGQFHIPSTAAAPPGAKPCLHVASAVGPSAEPIDDWTDLFFSIVSSLVFAS